jgi:hypothetical protein
MSKTISQTIDDLRGKLAASQGLQSELNAEIQEVSFLAHTGDIKSQKRLDEIRTALSKVDIEIRSLTAALATAANMQVAEQDAARAELQRANASKAEAILAEAESLATKMDAAMVSLKAGAVEFQAKMEMVRRLTNSGPQHQAIKVHLARAISSGLMGLPQHPDLLAPNERRSVTELATSWAQQVRNRISAVINTAEAA